MAVAGGTKSTLRVVIEKLLVRTSGGGTRFLNGRMLDRLEDTVIVSCGLVMLFAPLWALQTQVITATRLRIVTAFVVFFTLLLAMGAVGRPFEVLAFATM